VYSATMYSILNRVEDYDLQSFELLDPDSE
jgi:hypothetical protein